MSKLRVGAAKACVDPTPDMFPMDGWWGTVIEEIYSSVYIRALAIANDESTFLTLSYDTGTATEEMRKELSEMYDIPMKNIMACSTHNHGGPKTPKLQPILEEQTRKVVGEALGKIRPAKYGFGEGESYINVNRDLLLEDGTWAQADNFAGFSDRTLAILKFVDEDEKLIAVLLNHGTHANTTCGGMDVDGKSKTCGDFPGFTCEFLEKRYGNDAIVLWTSGSAGNQNAIQMYKGDEHYIGEENINYPDPHGMSYKYARYIGEKHAIDADMIMKGIECDRERIQLKSATTDVSFDTQKRPDGVDKYEQALIAQNAIRIFKKVYPDRKFDRQNMPESIPTGEKITCQMQLLLLGDIAIISAACELYAELGVLCKEASPYQKTFIITCASGHGEHVGYIQDDDSSHIRSFQHFSTVRPGNCNKTVLDGQKRMFDEIAK